MVDVDWIQWVFLSYFILFYKYHSIEIRFFEQLQLVLNGVNQGKGGMFRVLLHLRSLAKQ